MGEGGEKSVAKEKSCQKIAQHKKKNMEPLRENFIFGGLKLVLVLYTANNFVLLVGGRRYMNIIR